jgi:hypothetical protein
MQVSLHEFCHDVNIVVSGAGVRLDQVHQLDDVFVLEVFEKFYFSQDTFGIHKVLKCVLDLRQTVEVPS